MWPRRSMPGATGKVLQLPRGLHSPLCTSFCLPSTRTYHPSSSCSGERMVSNWKRADEPYRQGRAAGMNTGGSKTRRDYTRQLQALARGEGRLQGRALATTLGEMEKAGVRAKESVYMELLKRCKRERTLKESQRVHSHLLSLSSSRPLSPHLSTSLISTYGMCGRIDLALAVFEQTEERSVWTWNALMQAYSQCGHHKEVLVLFQQMPQAGVPPDAFTYAIVLKACANVEDLEMGKRVHAQLLDHGFLPDVVLSTALISLYGKCGKMNDARAVFQGMKERNVVTWNAMIGEETQHEHGKEALELFQMMQQAGVPPDSFTYAIVLKACTIAEDLEAGKRIHAQLLHGGFFPDVVLSTSLISMYARCGKMEEARAVFQGMKKRDVAMWNSMIAEEVQCGCWWEALELYQQMQQAGVLPNSFTYASVLKACAIGKDLETGKRIHTQLLSHHFLPDPLLSSSLIGMYGKCGKLEEARAVFQGMSEFNTVAWNSMITEEVQNGNGKEALELFQQMQQAGVPPDSFTYGSILKACASMADWKMGKFVHTQLLCGGFLPDVLLSNALINMYGKCGKVDDACIVFQEMNERNIISWNAMIAAYGLSGQGKEALATFHAMRQQGVAPDVITFTNVLNACSHAGLIEEGMACFADMKEKHGIQPTVDHYTCVVDLLGRARRLDEAEALINSMDVPPNSVTWMTLLGACRGAKDVKRAERAAEQAIKLGQQGAAPFVVLSNIFAAAGQWADVEKVRNEMKERKVKKEPGRSWITVDGQVHSFVVKDCSHPRSVEIYQELDRLSQQMKTAGYKPDTDWVLHDVPDEQKEVELCAHSEKLAIAFGLLSTSPGEPLCIIKNLRVCGDCHTATKFIAKVTQREILVRDANRFHQFSPDGNCSCGDYW
ncbi:Pentatricopeptide repeat protein [Balamuthia mandrillaris]